MTFVLVSLFSVYINILMLNFHGSSESENYWYSKETSRFIKNKCFTWTLAKDGIKQS